MKLPKVTRKMLEFMTYRIGIGAQEYLSSVLSTIRQFHNLERLREASAMWNIWVITVQVYVEVGQFGVAIFKELASWGHRRVMWL